MGSRKQTTLLPNFVVTDKRLRNSTEGQNGSEQTVNGDNIGASAASLDMIQQDLPKPERNSDGTDAMVSEIDGAQGIDLPGY